MTERETETIECRECGTEFNLAAQWYHDDLCPACKREAAGEKATWPGCLRCGERIRPDDVEYVLVSGARGSPERVEMHPSCAADHREERRAGR